MAVRVLLMLMLPLVLGTCGTDSPGAHDPTGDGIVTVGVYADEGAAEACVEAAQRMFQWMGYETKRIYARTVNEGAVDDIDVFYFPGGSSAPYRTDIGEAGLARLRDRIASGTAYIGTCAGGMFGAARNDWDGGASPPGLLGVFPGLAAGPIPEIYAYPDIGMCVVTMSRSHPITADLPDTAWILFYNGPFFLPDPGTDAEVIGRYAITGSAAIVVSSYGLGRVVLTGPHPEWEEDSDRDGVSAFDRFDDHGSDWELMRNATRWCLRQTG